MASETISEATFLLTELRYTLGQLHVQVLDLDEETRRNAPGGARSIEQILHDLLQSEEMYQGKYAVLLKQDLPDAYVDDQPVPLPINDADASRGQENTFEHKRAQTIAMLEKVPEPWTPDLLQTVKQQVAEDRSRTTEIAETRKQYFEHDQRPDLNAPLVTP